MKYEKSFWFPNQCSKNFELKQIKLKLDPSFIERVQNVVTKHVEPHKSHFGFYPTLNLIYFKEYTNSIHEGTNRDNSTPISLNTNIEKLWPLCVTILKELGGNQCGIIDVTGMKVYFKIKM